MCCSLIFNLLFLAIDVIVTLNLWTTWLDAVSLELRIGLTILSQLITIFICVLTCYVCQPCDKECDTTGDGCPMYCLIVDFNNCGSCGDCGGCGDCGDCGGLDCIDC